MNNMKSNVGSFAAARLQATMVKMFSILTIAAIIAFSMAACDIGGDSGGGGGYWLRTYSDGTTYNWITYNYKNDKNYEEEYTTETTNSISIYHYTRTGQTSTSITETFSRNSNSYSSGGYGGSVETRSFSSGTSSTNATYDETSGLALTYTTVSSGYSSSTISCNFGTGDVTKSTASPSQGATTGIIYTVELLSDTDGVRTYKHTPVGNNGYYIYKIKSGRTIEVSYYDASYVLIYTTTYTQPEDKIIRERLPRFTLYRTTYYSPSSSISSQYQTANLVGRESMVEVVGSSPSYPSPSYRDISDDDTMYIVITTFTDGVGSSIVETYEKINLNKREFDVSGDYRYLEQKGKITIVGFTNDKIVSANIPAQIDGKPVTAVGYGVFNNWWSLSSVTIPDSVTSLNGVNIGSDGSVYKYGSIGDSETYSAFSGCDRLTSVTLGSGFKEIGSNTFSGCWNLTNVTIPNSVTGIGAHAFYGCVSLTGITIPAGVTRIEHNAFYNCLSLESVTIPAGVTDIEPQAFLGCPNLTSVKFEGEIHPDNFGGWGAANFFSPFDGDLREKYIEGGKGTYTRTKGSYEWTKS